jgi:antibiotic biosynthesis monooxygenase (ABM) superfamily enzyme
MFKKLALSFLVAGLLTLGTATLSAQTSQTAPKSVIHVVTVKFKPGTTPAQIKAALDGVHALPREYKGITRVWTNSFKFQGDKTHAFVMEFVDQAALEAYTNSAAQKKWYEVYLPIRDQSTTFDITN